MVATYAVVTLVVVGGTEVFGSETGDWPAAISNLLKRHRWHHNAKNVEALADEYVADTHRLVQGKMAIIGREGLLLVSSDVWSSSESGSDSDASDAAAASSEASEASVASVASEASESNSTEAASADSEVDSNSTESVETNSTETENTTTTSTTITTTIMVDSTGPGEPAVCPTGFVLLDCVCVPEDGCDNGVTPGGTTTCNGGMPDDVVQATCRNNTITSVPTDSQTSPTATCPDSSPTIVPGQCMVIGDNVSQNGVIDTAVSPQTCTATCPAGVDCTIQIVCQ